VLGGSNARARAFVRGDGDDDAPREAAGAVSSGVLKGLQTVGVVTASAVFYCGREPTQCATPSKVRSETRMALLMTTTTPHGKIHMRHSGRGRGSRRARFGDAASG
jgi:hypothetical protein